MQRLSWVFIKSCVKGYKVYKNTDSELTEIFKKRDLDPNRIYCVYRVWSSNDIVVYVGQGVSSRPTSHSGDDVGNNLGLGWKVEIVADCLTKLEARICEAYLIRKEIKLGKSLTIPGNKWKGVGLMNKNKGMNDKDYNNYRSIYLWK